MTMELMPLEVCCRVISWGTHFFQHLSICIQCHSLQKNFSRWSWEWGPIFQKQILLLSTIFHSWGIILISHKNNHDGCSHYLLLRCAAWFNLLFSIFILPIFRLYLSSSVAIHTVDLFNWQLVLLYLVFVKKTRLYSKSNDLCQLGQLLRTSEQQFFQFCSRLAPYISAVFSHFVLKKVFISNLGK